MSKVPSPRSLSRRKSALAFVVLLAFAMLSWSMEPTSARQQELIHLVRQDCGSCHGLRLSGGLGLPLTPEALRERPAAGLVATILDGRPGTAMPPWRAFLTEAEAEWIVRQLIAGFPEEQR